MFCKQSGNLTLILQAIALQVDRVKYRLMQHVHLVHRFGRVVNLRVDLHQVIPQGWESNDLDVVTLSFFPGRQQRLKAETVGTAVPEGFQHFDLGSIVGVYGVRQLSVMGANHIALDLGEAGDSHW